MANTHSQRPVVLVVEDEPFLRIFAVDVIEDAGFDTVEAASGSEAIDVLTKRSDIRIVFTDIHMPGDLDGLQLAAAIRDRWPPVELLITSGLSSPVAEELPHRGRFISKPYDPERLISELRSFIN